MSGSIGRTFQMSGSGQETLPDVWELSGCPPKCPGVVESISRMSRSGWETLRGVREWWEALPKVRQWSGVYPKCPGVVGRPFWMSEIGRDALPDV